MFVKDLLNYIGFKNRIYAQRDNDVNPLPELQRALSLYTGIKEAAISACSVRSYFGQRFESFSGHQTPPWVVPIGTRHGRRSGVPYCRSCCSENVAHRKAWRLSVSVVCLKHSEWLRDDASCELAMEHRIFSKVLGSDAPMSYCQKCLTTVVAGSFADRSPDPHVLQAQQFIDSVLESGSARVGDTILVSSEFFQGLSGIVRLLYGDPTGARLRASIAAEAGFGCSLRSRSGDHFDYLSVHERSEILRCIPYILKGWPHEMQRHCQIADVSALRNSPLKRRIWFGPEWCRDSIMHVFDARAARRYAPKERRVDAMLAS